MCYLSFFYFILPPLSNSSDPHLSTRIRMAVFIADSCGSWKDSWFKIVRSSTALVLLYICSVLLASGRPVRTLDQNCPHQPPLLYCTYVYSVAGDGSACASWPGHDRGDQPQGEGPPRRGHQGEGNNYKWTRNYLFRIQRRLFKSTGSRKKFRIRHPTIILNMLENI